MPDFDAGDPCEITFDRTKGDLDDVATERDALKVECARLRTALEAIQLMLQARITDDRVAWAKGLIDHALTIGGA